MAHLPVQYALGVEHAVVEVCLMVECLRLRLASALFLTQRSASVILHDSALLGRKQW